MLDYYFAAAAASALILLPGILAFLALSKKLGLQKLDAAIFGACAGFAAIPLLGFLESLAGIPFSFELAAFNSLLFLLAAVALCIREKALQEFRLPESGKPLQAIKENWHVAAIALIFISAFLLRSISSQPFAFESDPYYYLRAAQFIAEDGSIPRFDTLAWQPLPSTHRERPLSLYFEAQAFALSSGGAQFSKTDFYAASSIYPPLAGALACLLAYSLVSSEYGRKWGVLAAALIAFTPEAVYKFSAGVVEQQPWGLFALFFFASAYAFHLKKGGRALALVAGFALLAAVLGSKQDIIALAVFAGVSFLLSAKKILSSGGASRGFAESHAIIASGGIAAFLLMLPYAQIGYSTPALALAGAVFPAAAFALTIICKDPSTRIKAAAAASLAALLILLITPLGPMLYRFAAGQRFLGESQGIYSAVAEEMGASGALAKGIGFFGLSFGSLGLGNLFLAGAFLALAFAAAYRDSDAAILFAFLCLPLLYFGMQTDKFIVHYALALSILVAATLGEIGRQADAAAERLRPPPPTLQYSFGTGDANATIVKKDEGSPLALKAPLAVAAIGALVLLAQIAWLYGDAGSLMDSAFMKSGSLDCSKLSSAGKRTAYLLSCSKMGTPVMNAMGWLEGNSGNASTLAWWDYGHWINYLGQSKAVIRGDLYYPEMVLSTAEAFTSQDPRKLDGMMSSSGSKFALFSFSELLKWDAITYLSCLKRGETNASFSQSSKSACEKSLEFEYFYIPLNAQASRCAISSSLLRVTSNYNKTYCVSDPSSIGLNSSAKTYMENGTLVNADLQYVTNVFTGPVQNAVILMLYNNESWQYRNGGAYDSNYYRGFYLRNLSGYSQAYPAGGSRADIIILKKN